MSSKADKPRARAPNTTAPLVRALHQSEQVHDKVEQAAVDLSSVNTLLKDGIAEGVPVAKVARALHQNETVEVKVQDAAAELVVVNDTLAEGIDEHRHMEHRLSTADAELSESQANEKKARHSALHDAVTGLPNLTLFNDRLRTALAQAQRHTWRLAVMFIDLDDFKKVNDARGHDVGDRVLQMVAQRLQAVVRGGDTVSRRSGDEFLVLMVEAKDESSVAAFAARIAGNIGEACEIDGMTLTVTASIGIAVYPDDGRTAQELLKKADQAMYAGKRKKDLT